MCTLQILISLRGNDQNYKLRNTPKVTKQVRKKYMDIYYDGINYSGQRNNKEE